MFAEQRCRKITLLSHITQLICYHYHCHMQLYPRISFTYRYVLNQHLRDSKDRSLQWRYNGHEGVSNHQPHHCLLNRLYRHKSKKTSKLRVTGLCEGNSPVTGEFPVQMASNAENVSIWWRHHVNTSAEIYGMVLFGQDLTSPWGKINSRCGWV